MASLGIILSATLTAILIVIFVIFDNLIYILPYLSYLLLVVVLIVTFTLKRLKYKKILITELNEEDKIKYRKVAAELYLKGYKKDYIIKEISKEGIAKGTIEKLLDV